MQRYQGLDALRGVAAAAIVIVHYDLYRGVPSFSGGVLAVDIFFALSGFVIADAYEQKLRNGMSSARFVSMRFLRFYPVYLVGLAISLSALVFRGFFGNAGWEGVDPTAIFLSIFMIPSIHRANVPEVHLFILNIVVWSLFFEFLVNAIFGFLLYNLKTRTLMGLCFFLLPIVVFYSISYNGVDAGFDWGTFNFGFVRAFISFTVGMVVFRVRDSLPVNRIAMSISPLVLVGALISRSYMQDVSIFDILFISMLVPLMLAFNANKVEFPIFASLFRFLAYVSYALYMIHVPLNAFFGGVYHRYFSSSLVLSLGFASFCFFLTIAFSYLVTRFIDDPVRVWLKARSRLRLINPRLAEAE